jgi:hypothetical protein
VNIAITDIKYGGWLEMSKLAQLAAELQSSATGPEKLRGIMKSVGYPMLNLDGSNTKINFIPAVDLILSDNKPKLAVKYRFIGFKGDQAAHFYIWVDNAGNITGEF